jgi:hypothetical protein
MDFSWDFLPHPCGLVVCILGRVWCSVCQKGFFRVFFCRQKSRKVKQIIGYFNNHYHGYAPENCQCYLIEKMGLLSEKEKRAQKAKPKQSTPFEYTM